MTVLALRLSRRANAVSALHGEVSRAMWTGLFPRQARRRSSDRPHHQRRACPVVAGSADVPPVRSPPGHRLAAAQRRSRIWEGIENVDDGELWETHLSLKSQLIEFVRRRAVEQASAAANRARTLQRLEPRA